MPIYLSFFLIFSSLLSLVATSSQANYDAARKLSFKLTDIEKVYLTKELLMNLIELGDHDSDFRAGLIKSNIEQTTTALFDLLNPKELSPNTPHRELINSKKMARFGKLDEKKDGVSCRLMMDREFCEQKQAIYIHSPLDLHLEPLDLGGKALNGKMLNKPGKIFDFINKNKENIMILINEFSSGRDFYIGRIHANSWSKAYNMATRMSNHAMQTKKAFPNRKAEASKNDLYDGHPIYSQPLVINMYPKDVEIIEGLLIHFFPWPALQNSISGKTHSKHNKPDPELADKLTNLYNKMAQNHSKILSDNLDEEFRKITLTTPKPRKKRKRASSDF